MSHTPHTARRLCRARQQCRYVYIYVCVCVSVYLLPLWPVKRAHPINLIHLPRHLVQRPSQVCVCMYMCLHALLLLVTFHFCVTIPFETQFPTRTLRLPFCHKPLSIHSLRRRPLLVCQECLLCVGEEKCIECNSFPNECHASFEYFNDCLILLYICSHVCMC